MERQTDCCQYIGLSEEFPCLSEQGLGWENVMNDKKQQVTPKMYYGELYPKLQKGEKALLQLLETYPVKETKDGIEPIIYLQSRIKNPGSLEEKLQRKGLDVPTECVYSVIHDVIGIRIVCSFIEEVYHVADWICRQPMFCVLEKKDYISYPKENGYRSLHLILKFAGEEWDGLTAEIQIRTIAHDFWAALEHQIKYKKHVTHEMIVQGELKRCADEIASLDVSLQTIRDIIREDKWEI